MTSETYPSGRQVITEYDTAGRAAGISARGYYYAGASPSDATNRIQYAPQGAVSVMQLGNGKWEHTNFNNRLQPTQIGLGTSGTDSSILKLDYGYGTTTNNGNVLSQTITTPNLTLNQCYGYDYLNRLSTADEHSGTTCAGAQQWKQAFTYDRFGNRNFDVVNTTSNVLGPNPTISQSTNRIASGQNYGYDSAGNLTSDPTTPVNGIVYDAENRQTQYTKSQQATNYYYYDGDGHRVKKIDNSGTTVFVYDVSGQLIAEYTAGNPSGGGTSYLTSDHLGSTRVVVKSDGTTTRHDYLPFGEEIQAGIGGRTTGQGYVADNVRQKFTQKERDSESGLDYFGARYYSSAQGRFTGVDPKMIKKDRLVDPQRINLYAYVRNTPLKYVDPDGADLLLAQGISNKNRKFIVNNLARYYMTEAGKKVIEHLDKVPFRIALGKGDLERKELNPPKMGEYKIGGEEHVTGGVTTVPYTSFQDQRFLAAEGVGDKKPGPAITVTIDPANSSDIGKDPATVMAHELGGHTSEAVDLAMRPSPGDPNGEYGPGRNITEYFGKGETASKAAEKAPGKLPDKPTPEAIKAVEEILKRREQ